MKQKCVHHQIEGYLTTKGWDRDRQERGAHVRGQIPFAPIHDRREVAQRKADIEVIWQERHMSGTRAPQAGRGAQVANSPSNAP